MQGLGNDFVVLDATRRQIALSSLQARRLADRHFGVGCDQILIVEAPSNAEFDFNYRILNADGEEVEQCGNGARCFVRFVHDRQLTDRREIRVSTRAGPIVLKLEDNGEVTVDMGRPQLAPARIPFDSPSDAIVQPLELADTTAFITAVSMGNPHAVQVVADVDTAPVATMGATIENHPRFPHRVNAGFMQVEGRHAIRLRVYERGAGETLACGTGACAAVVAGILRGLLASPVRVRTRGGDLSVAWAGSESDPNCSVFMTGPAVSVFRGEIEL